MGTGYTPLMLSAFMEKKECALFLMTRSTCDLAYMVNGRSALSLAIHHEMNAFAKRLFLLLARVISAAKVNYVKRIEKMINTAQCRSRGFENEFIAVKKAAWRKYAVKAEDAVEKFQRMRASRSFWARRKTQN